MVALVADTHMPKGARALPERCLELLAGAELIIHAGDFSRLTVLEELERLGPPVAAVFGNVDERPLRERLPERRELSWHGHSFGVIHDAGPRRGRLERLRRAFPGAEAVIFGHSHLPLHEIADDGFQIFNPGSPTERRRAPSHTMGLMSSRGGRLEFELVEL